MPRGLSMCWTGGGFWDNWPLLSPSHKLTAVAWTEFPSTPDIAQICIITRATSAEISHARRYEKCASTRRKYPASNFGWAPHSPAKQRLEIKR